MLTTSTLEIRWFEYGSIPVSVKEWFSNNCPGRLLGELPEIREDLYLLLPECETLSLKLRQGNLELKLRQANLGIKSFGAVGNQVGWKGQAEKWLKWRYEKEEIAPLRIMNQEVEDLKSWLKVKKRRSQRLYRGSCCELTQLEVNNHLWWSIAFRVQIRLRNDYCEFGRTESIAPDNADRHRFRQYDRVLRQSVSGYRPQRWPNSRFDTSSQTGSAQLSAKTRT